jgi:hypothetical protein
VLDDLVMVEKKVMMRDFRGLEGEWVMSQVSESSPYYPGARTPQKWCCDDASSWNTPVKAHQGVLVVEQ